MRRTVTAVAGVLAQFGGVTLAIAFIVSVGNQGLLTVLLRDAGLDVSGGWLYELSGLVVVYLYFQIPLMVLVFLPAGRDQAAVARGHREPGRRNLGVLAACRRTPADPAVPGAFLLLFANAFAAYATAAALISQGGIIIPLQIRAAMTSETVLGQENVAKALALGMVIVVAVAMALYSWMQRRSSRWLQ